MGLTPRQPNRWEFGYMVPEHSCAYKSTTCSDVYSSGICSWRWHVEEAYRAREVLCRGDSDGVCPLLWKDGRILDAMDKRLGNSYVVEEAELVLKMGMLCSQAVPELRPSMPQFVG
uniref:Serine-threonine/tyrosine-protein kinase catalytic domain-containing protein n=1 Tax=Nymphaea colorata TaxID=210225 RepID=A0A5K1HU48_9MAGN|nr:unnamed protein product [Nymphaea colorata]